MTYEVYFAVASNLVPAVAAGVLGWYCTSPAWAARLRSGRPLPRSAPSARRVAVGGGWSFFLQRTPLPGVPRFTRGTRGRLSNGRWRAGSSIGEVQTHLRARGQTLTAHPSVLSATLGGWIASGSHGSGGTLWESCIGRVSVMDQKTSEVLHDVDPRRFFGDDKSVEEQRDYVITEVEVLPVEDVVCRRVVRKVVAVDGVRDFLTTPSYLRILQIGARGVMSLVWEPVLGPPPPVAPKTAVDQVRLWWHADALSIFQSDAARDRAWFDWPVPKHMDALVRLSDANHFTPTPPLLLTATGMQYTNFEVFVRWPTMTAEQLWDLCSALQDMLATRVHGRCELRYGRNGKLFLDFAFRNGTFTPRTVFDTLANVVGADRKVWLHKGKFQVPTAPFA